MLSRCKPPFISRDVCPVDVRLWPRPQMGNLIIKFFFAIVVGSMIFCMGCSHRIPAGMPIRVSTNNQLTADDMITAFYQGRAGNCATISVIKAAMLKYGPDSVIFCEKKNGFYKVILHNKSDSLSITNAEIDTLNAKDKFIAGTDTNIYNKARFLYAVVAKRKFQDTTGKRYKSVSAAADALNGGENLGSRNIFPLLGLTASKAIDLTDISKHCNLIITSKFHSAFSSKGYYDEYGGKAMVSDFKYNHRRGLLFWQSANVTDAFYIMP